MSFPAYEITNLTTGNIFLEEGVIPPGQTKVFKNYTIELEKGAQKGLISVKQIIVDDANAIGKRIVTSDPDLLPTGTGNGESGYSGFSGQDGVGSGFSGAGISGYSGFSGVGNNSSLRAFAFFVS